MKTDAAFWDGIAPKYAEQAISDEAAYELTLERSMSYLAPEHRVLELGCGTGSTALRLAGHVREILGTDLSPKMVEIARAKAVEEDLSNARFEAEDVKAALARGERPDVVMGHNIFHLIEDMPGAFSAIGEALPKGGLFISKTPCLRDVGALKRLAFGALIPVMRLFGKAPRHVSFFTSRALEAEIEAAGFEIIEALSAPKISRCIVARKREAGMVAAPKQGSETC